MEDRIDEDVGPEVLLECPDDRGNTVDSVARLDILDDDHGRLMDSEVSEGTLQRDERPSNGEGRFVAVACSERLTRRGEDTEVGGSREVGSGGRSVVVEVGGSETVRSPAAEETFADEAAILTCEDVGPRWEKGEESGGADVQTAEEGGIADGPSSREMREEGEEREQPMNARGVTTLTVITAEDGEAQPSGGEEDTEGGGRAVRYDMRCVRVRKAAFEVRKGA